MEDHSIAEARRIFELALESPPGDRQRLVDQACGHDGALRRAVAHLLEIDRQLEGAVPGSAASEEAPPAGGAGQGATLGRYLLFRRLGQGSTAAVYLGRRKDLPEAPEVAVKVLRPEVAPRLSAQARFELEQRILAKLEHPNIARFLDSGVDRGRPYVVMERVEGLPVTDHCDSRCLDLRSRLRLFGKICDAITYAHQRLVIHRDLKPGNVLVTEAGEPKVLDFGIAKLLDGSGDETLPQERALTPNYASPEQLRGEAVTLSSDVYSLGVILYELLAGVRPFDRGAAWRAPAVLVQAEEPRPPGEAFAGLEPAIALGLAAARSARPRTLMRELTGDLGTIVGKALRGSPGDRYATVAELAGDLRRYLAARPVLARPRTPLYRYRKWLQRNPLAAGGFALSFVLLLALAAAMVNRHFRIVEERKNADLERQRSERVLGFLVEALEGADPRSEGGGVLTVRDLLTSAAGEIEEELGLFPDSAADVRHTVGVALTHLGAFEEAEPLLELALERRRRGDDVGQAQTLVALAEVARAGGDYSRAREVAARALDLHAGDARVDPETLAVAHRNLALALLFEGDHGAAEEHARTSLELLDSGSRGSLEGQAEARLTLASVLVDGQRFEEAGDNAQRALELLELAGVRQSLLASEVLQVQAIVSRSAGDLERALELQREMLAIRERVLGPEAFRVAEGLHSYGSTSWRAEKDGEAVASLRRAVKIYRAASPLNQPALAKGLHDLGCYLVGTGAEEEGTAHLLEALEIRRRTSPASSDLVESLESLARLRLFQGRRREAAALIREASESLPQEPRRDIAISTQRRNRVAETLRLLGEEAQAEEVLREGLPWARAKLGAEHSQVRRIEALLAAWQEGP